MARETAAERLNYLFDASKALCLTDRAHFIELVKYISEQFFNSSDLNFWRKIASGMMTEMNLRPEDQGVWEKWKGSTKTPESLAQDISANIRKCGADRYELVVRYVFDAYIEVQMNNLQQVVGKDQLYYGILQSLGIKISIARQYVPILTGTYQFWRFANRVSGHCLKGMYQIRQTPSGAVEVLARQRYEPSTFPNDAQHLSPRFYEYSGYVVKNEDRRTFMIFTDGQSGFAVSNYFNEVDYVPDRPNGDSRRFTTGGVLQMSGTSMGVDGNITFSSPIYVERVSDEALDAWDGKDKFEASLNLYPFDQTPTRVLGTLRFLAGYNNRSG